MKRTLRLHLALLLVGLAPAGGTTMAAPAAGAAPGVAPALIVVIIVDQLPAGTLERLGPLLSGGYRLLLDRGRRFTRCRHDHAVTETGPGHATLLSGLFPSHNGIILNHWHDTTAHADVYCIRDPEAGSRRSWPGAARRPVSPDNLEGENLADLLGRAARGAKVFTVAGKDRAAVLTAGHHPDGAFWFDVFTGGFTSSPGVVEGLPPWGAGFWGDGPVRTGLYKREIPDEWTYPERPEARPDDYPYEAPGLSRVGPHPVARVDAEKIDPDQVAFTRGTQVAHSPWLDRLTLDLAGRIIDANGLGRDDTTDLLVVGLSASDIVGHSYGPASQEYLDTILRVDRWLDEFIQHAEAAGAASRGGVVFALSSDHGVLPLPETLPWGRRIDREALLSRFEAALNASLDPEEPDHFVESFHSGHIYFDRRALGRHDVSIDRAREQARKILTGLAGIVRVYRPVDLAASSGGDPFLELYRHSYDPRRGGDLVVQPCRGCLLVSSAEGTSHGSPYAYDRDVPMILMGPGIEPGESDEGCRTVDLAPTLAALAGLAFDAQRDGRPLALRSTEAAAGRNQPVAPAPRRRN